MHVPSAATMAKVHLALLLAWAIAIPATYITGWIESVIFVSLASIYANMATHWSAYQAAHGEQRQEENGN